ncbi:glycosyltransferase [Nocardiopsis sp. CNT312]|uniref:glycosyltransferase n=1 Tax=Nocardiopsis sp. CNT312 TaxID=1137268 RepID=UPI00048D7C9F|nr:glycosyltransferase [Nocardiopsis sp. CNT312]
MITTVLRNALRTRGPEAAVLCHAGAHDTARAPLTGLPLRSGDRLVDLDTHPMGEQVLEGDPETTEAGLVAVVAATATDLNRALTVSTHLPRAVHVVVALVSTPGHQDPPIPASPGLGQWRDIQEVRVRRMEDRGWLCELFFPNAVDTPEALDAVMHGTRGRRRAPALGPLAALHGAEGALWRPGDIKAVGVPAEGPVPLRRVSPRADLALRLGGEEVLPEWSDPAPALGRATTGTDAWERIAAPGGHARARTVDAAVREAGDEVVHTVAPIDELTVNPVGFTKRTGAAMADLTVGDGRAVVRQGGKDLVVVPADGTVTDVDLSRLRSLRGVRVDWSGHTGPASAVRAVASLAAGGVPLVSGPVPGWAAALGRPLTEALLSAEERDLAHLLTREEHSVRLRRAALDTHGLRARWRAMAVQAGLPVPAEPTVSVILCTRRPEMVGFALAQIARQRGVDVEVVLTLHGFPASLPEVAPALAGFQATGLPVTVHEAPADQIFGAVLNDTVARASGDLIAKWDDDDWYGPDHLSDLLLARTYSGAELIGCSQDFVYLQEVDRTVMRRQESERSGRFIAGGTILTDRVVLEETGGFRPLPRAIDSQLLLAVVQGGGRIHRTHGLGYVLRRTGGGHTWSEDIAYFLRNTDHQWSGWHPSALLEGEPVPFGQPANEHTGDMR